VTEEQQATFTVDGVQWATERWPWSGVFAIWYFRHEGGRISPDDAAYYFRMVDPDFTPRRLLFGVGEASRELAVAGAGAWAERSAPVRLAVRLDAAGDVVDDWRWEWRPGAIDGNAVASGRPGAELSFRFTGPSVAVQAWRGPGAGRLAATLDGRPVSFDGGGGSVSLDSGLVPDSEPGWSPLTVADGLGPGEHVLTLRSVGDGEVAIDGFQVGAPSGAPRRDPWPFVLAALSALLAAQLALDALRAASRIRL
jgi:hypothetical protein